MSKFFILIDVVGIADALRRSTEHRGLHFYAYNYVHIFLLEKAAYH
jgi:hypothetical protein